MKMILLIGCSSLIGFLIPKLCVLVIYKKQVSCLIPTPRTQLQAQVISALLLLLVSYILLHSSFQWLEQICYFVFACFLLMISWTDTWSGYIFNVYTYPAIVGFCCFRLTHSPETWSDYLLGATLFGVLIYTLAYFTGGIGYGDGKLMVASGFVLPLSALFLALWIATCSALFYVLRRKNLRTKKPLPFGPHLAIGCGISLLWGEQLINWYLKMI